MIRWAGDMHYFPENYVGKELSLLYLQSKYCIVDKINHLGLALEQSSSPSFYAEVIRSE